MCLPVLIKQMVYRDRIYGAFEIVKGVGLVMSPNHLSICMHVPIVHYPLLFMVMARIDYQFNSFIVVSPQTKYDKLSTKITRTTL